MKHSTSESYSITRCASKTVKPILTNEEWFCSLATEQKAEFMGDIWGRGYLTSHFEGNLEFGKKQDKAYWEMWLKQPHTTIKE